MSITTKQARCARWCWGYITKYPYSCARTIAGAQTDYGYSEVVEALGNLEASGYIRRADTSHNHGYYQWVALVPFVVEAPAWAV